MTEYEHSAVAGLTRGERLDFRMSRHFPKLTPRVNRLVFRMTSGRVGGSKRGIPIGLLTATGQRSGKPRTVPLMYFEDGPRFIVVSSNGGFDSPPAWHRNLLANPTADFRIRRGVVKVVARDMREDEQVHAWTKLAEYNPLWAAFQSCTERRTIAVVLESTTLS